MNLRNARSYEDAGIVCGAEIACCVFYHSSAPLLAVAVAATLAFVAQRLRDADGNIAEVRRLAALVFSTWVAWLAWGAAAPGLRADWAAKSAYSAALFAAAHYCVAHEHGQFLEHTARSRAILAATVLAALAPVNLARDTPLTALLLQSVLHCVCTFALFFVRVHRKCANAPNMLFLYSLWILAAFWPLVCVFGMADLAMSAREFAGIWGQHPEEGAAQDAEAPQPRPAARPPERAPDGPRLLLQRAAERELARVRQATEFQAALRPPPALAEPAPSRFNLSALYEADC